MKHMERVWFVLQKDTVSGPLATADLMKQLEQGVLHQGLIWWRGQREWVPIQKWKLDLPVILEALKKPKDKAIWYLIVDRERIGPICQNEIVKYVTPASGLAHIRLWTQGLSEWQSIFKFPEIMDNLGISRRKTERVALHAMATLNRKSGSLICPTTTISLGGLGINGADKLVAGEHVQVVVKSVHLSTAITASAEVRYVAGSEAGLMFTYLSQESLAHIHEYTRRKSADDSATKVTQQAA